MVQKLYVLSIIKIMLTDIYYILSSYIEVINYNQLCIKNNYIYNKNLYENNKHYNKKRRIEKHPFDKYSLSEKESLKLFYLLKRGI